jgi:tetratricopeptide (TPR) repeat protein
MPGQWKIGDRIQDRWEIHKILGGGMGVVFVVYDHELQEPFAAKTFQETIFSRNPTISDLFVRETLAWVNLDIHPNIVRAHFVMEIALKPFLFLEYVCGGDLSAWIGRTELTRDVPQVMRFALQFCDGMIHASAKGIKVHRDIKPQNCLVTADKTLKVSDFGLAKLLEELGPETFPVPRQKMLGLGFLKSLLGKKGAGAEADPLIDAFLSRTGAGAGTPTHMAPEQFDDAKHVSASADVYSFGIMLYQMLTGELPFVGRSLLELRQLHTKQPPPRLSSQAHVLEDILERCLAKEPSKRFPSFAELRPELVSVYENLTGEMAPRAAAGIELNAMALSDKGISLAALGKYQAALESLDRAMEELPLSCEVLSNRGIVLKRLGQLQEALISYDRAIAANSKYEKAWTNKGVALEELGRPEESLACQNMALQLRPDYAGAWQNKAHVLLYGLKRYGEALASAQRAKELGASEAQLLIEECIESSIESAASIALAPPAEDEVLLRQGIELAQVNRLQEAVAHFDRALEKNRRNKELWASRGTALAELGRCKEATDSLNMALELDAEYSYAWYVKGTNYESDQKRWDEAIVCYDRTIRSDPSFERAWANKGSALCELQRYEEALPCFEYALTLEPCDEKAWNAKGMALLSLGRQKEALVAFEEARRLGHPRAAQMIDICRRVVTPIASAQITKNAVDTIDLTQLAGIAATFVSSKRWEEAIKVYEEILEADSGSIRSWTDKGIALMEVARDEEALGCFERAVDLNSSRPEAWFNKGSGLMKLKEPRKALACWIAALELDPRYADAWVLKGHTLLSIDRPRQAQRCFEVAQHLGHPSAPKSLALCRSLLAKGPT